MSGMEKHAFSTAFGTGAVTLKEEIRRVWTAVLVLVVCLFLGACSTSGDPMPGEEALVRQDIPVEDYFDAGVKDAPAFAGEEPPVEGEGWDDRPEPEGAAAAPSDRESDRPSSAAALKETLGIVEDFRPSLSHGSKTAEHQRYIVLHDTEGSGSPASVVDWWDSNGNLVGAHFVVGKDGSIVQCVPLDEIAHHAGYGDAGHNDLYGIREDGRDDMAGSVPIGSWAPDYGMNAWSVGIEMVHQGGEGDYPAAQLEAVDGLIAYIDAYYGFESDIIDHKAWRSGNSDTSEEFASYLLGYQRQRTHQ